MGRDFPEYTLNYGSEQRKTMHIAIRIILGRSLELTTFVDRDGKISYDEMLQIVEAIYKMVRCNAG